MAESNALGAECVKALGVSGRTGSFLRLLQAVRDCTLDLAVVAAQYDERELVSYMRCVAPLLLCEGEEGEVVQHGEEEAQYGPRRGQVAAAGTEAAEAGEALWRLPAAEAEPHAAAAAEEGAEGAWGLQQAFAAPSGAHATLGRKEAEVAFGAAAAGGPSGRERAEVGAVGGSEWGGSGGDGGGGGDEFGWFDGDRVGAGPTVSASVALAPTAATASQQPSSHPHGIMEGQQQHHLQQPQQHAVLHSEQAQQQQQQQPRATLRASPAVRGGGSGGGDGVVDDDEFGWFDDEPPPLGRPALAAADAPVPPPPPARHLHPTTAPGTAPRATAAAPCTRADDCRSEDDLGDCGAGAGLWLAEEDAEAGARAETSERRLPGGETEAGAEPRPLPDEEYVVELEEQASWFFEEGGLRAEREARAQRRALQRLGGSGGVEALAAQRQPLTAHPGRRGGAAGAAAWGPAARTAAQAGNLGGVAVPACPPASSSLPPGRRPRPLDPLSRLVCSAALGLAHGRHLEMQLAAAAVLLLLRPALPPCPGAAPGTGAEAGEAAGAGAVGGAASSVAAVSDRVRRVVATLRPERRVLTAEVAGTAAAAAGGCGATRGVVVPLAALSEQQAALAARFFQPVSYSTAPVSYSVGDTAAQPSYTAVFLEGALQYDHAALGPRVVTSAADLAGAVDPAVRAAATARRVLRSLAPHAAALLLASGHIPDEVAAAVYDISGGAVLAVGGLGLRAVRAAAAACGAAPAASLSFLSGRTVARGVRGTLAAGGLGLGDYRALGQREEGQQQQQGGRAEEAGGGWVTVLLAHRLRSGLEVQAAAFQACLRRLLAALRAGRVLPGAGAWELAVSEQLLRRAEQMERVLEAERELYRPLSYRAVAAALRDLPVVLLQNGGYGYGEAAAAAAACAQALREGDVARLRGLAAGRAQAAGPYGAPVGGSSRLSTSGGGGATDRLGPPYGSMTLWPPWWNGATLLPSLSRPSPSAHARTPRPARGERGGEPNAAADAGAAQ
ncbi:hypothetical protein TSOC_011065 [Tetrabaena socialis]|uniref:Uncharacterized protein n=1 Tax=Tetrabaena socialis TaxID=47790 RepID=A0A2J7ZRM5_9CHLO|nr:hypothetical protein TSOC_011065 [Tetrabaena socialis]|eukprot:PNH02919.1 hypothetical protein TSOC_011065 [Tetrabaena socialis]